MDLTEQTTRDILSCVNAYSVLSHDQIVNYFKICWLKSVDKGDHGKLEDVPGELADCTISLFWLVQKNNITLDNLAHAEETSQSVYAWCEEHYPNKTIEEKLLATVEELAEMVVCQGCDLEEYLAIIADQNDQDVPEFEAAHANVQKSLIELAASGDLALGKLLDQKMLKNRERTIEESAARNALKTQRITQLKHG